MANKKSPLKKKETKKPEKKKEVKKDNSKNDKINKVLEELNKKFGKNALTKGVDVERYEIERIPTGSFSLDIDLGGGIPVGRYIEIGGPFSSTKTAQSLHILANAQKMGMVCALLDIECTTTKSFAKKIGVDWNNLIYANPSSMEEALQMMLDLQQSEVVHFCVLDSIAQMLASEKELESEVGESVQMGLPQKALGSFFKRYTMYNNKLVREEKRPFTLIGINQEREKIGGYGYDNTYLPGGNAKNYSASVIIRLRRGDWITEGSGVNKEIVGQVVKYKVEKNKTYKRMQSGEFDFYYAKNNTNIDLYQNDTIKEVILNGVTYGVIERAGAWFRYKEEKYQGLDSIVEALRSNEELVKEIKEKVLFISTEKEV